MPELADIARAPRTLLTRSSTLQPARLLAEARRVDADITLDELTAARLVASEHGRGSPAEMCCIVDAELNRSSRSGESLTAHLTSKDGLYGPQDASRPASTRQNPTLRHLAAARAVLHGDARGIARGAHRFFDPRTQDSSYRAYKAGRSTRVHSCSALGVLTAWSYDRPKCSGNRCCGDGLPVATPNGRSPEAWVGPIAGVDAWQLMLMKPSSYGAEHDAAYAAAAQVIRARSGLPGLFGDPVAQLVALAFLKLAVLG